MGLWSWRRLPPPDSREKGKSTCPLGFWLLLLAPTLGVGISELSRAVIPYSFRQYQIRWWRSVQVSVSSLECTLKVTYFKTSLRFCNSNFFFWEEFNHIVYKNSGKFESHHSIFRTCFKDISFVEIFLLYIYPPLIKDNEIIGLRLGSRISQLAWSSGQVCILL